MDHPTSSPKLSALAISEWLLVLPATLLLAAGVLRQLQPRQFEPGRTAWVIFEWTATHISQAGAAWLFLVLPAAAALAGCVGLMRAWRKSATLRQDTVAVLTSIRRNLVVTILATGTLLAASIIAVVIVHIITD